MIAIFGNLHFTELILIAVIAIMIFGRRLPQTLAKLFVQLQRVRNSVQQVWRETGISHEMRSLQNELHRELPRGVNPMRDVQRKVQEVKDEILTVDAGEPEVPEESVAPPPYDPQEDYGGEDAPAPEPEKRPEGDT